MIEARTERIDHLGIIAGVIKDLQIVELIDKRIPKDDREEISTGEAVAGMILNGLGFSDRPLTLTPQFFETKAISRLFREEAKAEHFNRFKLARALDNCYEYGCDILFAEISLNVCQQEKIDNRFNSLDTTTFSLTGEYIPDTDENVIEITHGYSKDHRPDLKQVMLELMTTQDGGVPVISKAWNGNASDTKIFRERASKLIKDFKKGPTPRYLIGDSKLYDAKTVDQCLRHIPFITRIPRTITLEKDLIKKANKTNRWEKLNDKEKYFSSEVEHYGIDQRWLVVQSEESIERATKSVKKQIDKEGEKIEKALKKLSKQKYCCREDGIASLVALQKKFKFHKIILEEVIEHKIFLVKGRPRKDSDYLMEYQIIGTKKRDLDKKADLVRNKSCYVIGTNIEKNELSDEEVIVGYKGQNTSVEKGFRFLKDPLMFTSSFFIKKPERIMGLMMVMTLALLVYSIAQRQVRKVMEKLKETVADQSGKQTIKPTLRWLFQILEGVEIVQVSIEGKIHKVISGMNALKTRIIGYFSEAVQKIYKIDEQPARL